MDYKVNGSVLSTLVAVRFPHVAESVQRSTPLSTQKTLEEILL